MSATKKQAKACYDNYFGVLRCLNGGTREENERSAAGCREAIRPYANEANELVKNPSKLLREDAWLMRALSEDIPNNFAAFNRNYPDLIESAAQAVEEIGEDELERFQTATNKQTQHTPGLDTRGECVIDTPCNTPAENADGPEKSTEGQGACLATPPPSESGDKTTPTSGNSKKPGGLRGESFPNPDTSPSGHGQNAPTTPKKTALNISVESNGSKVETSKRINSAGYGSVTAASAATAEGEKSGRDSTRSTRADSITSLPAPTADATKPSTSLFAAGVATRPKAQAKFTPGPWEVRQITDTWATVAPVGKSVESTVCHFDDSEPMQAHDHANARLIASAPELLAIAKEIANSGCDLGDSERRIRLYHAITKAGGEL